MAGCWYCFFKNMIQISFFVCVVFVGSFFFNGRLLVLLFQKYDSNFFVCFVFLVPFVFFSCWLLVLFVLKKK